MFIMYVDDSGDSGANLSVTQHFILSALVIHELRWNEFLEELIKFRQHLRDTKSLKLREEIHSVELINGKTDLTKRIPRNDRLDILKQCLDWLATRPDISIFSVVVDKSKHLDEDIYTLAWKTLIQRFENTISYKNFPGPSNPDDRGIIISDKSDEKKLRTIMRTMRKYNPITNRRDAFPDGYRNLQLRYIIEDPNFRDTNDSYILQLVDVVAYFMMQNKRPNKFIRKKSAVLYHTRLNPVLNTFVSKSKSGIVEI